MFGKKFFEKTPEQITIDQKKEEDDWRGSGIAPSEKEPGTIEERTSTDYRNKLSKALFIDDKGDYLASLARAFRDESGVVFAECHNVEEALAAVDKHLPKVLFLDHNLSGDSGDEGFEIAEALQGKGITIYSTSAYKQPRYEAMGVAYLGKATLKEYREIISKIEA
ncbi:MAG: hypothetical protein WCW02_03840 [Candidatus Buchananbacteria bacterium]